MINQQNKLREEIGARNRSRRQTSTFKLTTIDRTFTYLNVPRPIVSTQRSSFQFFIRMAILCFRDIPN